MAAHGGTGGCDDVWTFGYTDYGRGLISCTDITQGQQILKIPRELFFSSAKAFSSEKYGHIFKDQQIFHQNASFTLVAFLLLHSIDPDSFWRPYIDALPRKDLVLPSFMCSPKELTPLTECNHPVLVDISKLLINHLQLYFALREIFQQYGVYPSLRWYDYAWAAAMVMTRQSALEDNVISLIPAHDFVNCQQTGVTNSDYDGDFLYLLAAENVPQNSEIFMNYGSRNSSQMLCMNGFVCESNAYDTYKFQLALDAEDPLNVLKR